MRKMRSFFASALAFAVVLTGISVPHQVQAADETAAAPVTGENFLQQIVGEYQPLFEGATFNTEYDHYWHDYTAAVVGDSQANDTVAYLKSSIGASGYGDKAEAPNFFCGFTHDVENITFGGEDGKTVTYKKKDGSQVVHEYEYVKEAAASGKYNEYDMAMDGHLYKAKDDKDDEFEYLLMFPDTPKTTYHLEFRYGPSEAEVEQLLSGPYAYWVGSAIPSSALKEENEDTLQNVISLFVVENLVSMAGDETKAQRAGLVGTWDCDFSAFPEYAGASMYIELAADGTGKTYADLAGTGKLDLVSQYTFFAYDNDKSDGKDAGTYIAFNEAAETVTPGGYEVGTVNGKKALIFTSNEGNITYLYRETAPAPAPAVKKAANPMKVKVTSKTYKKSKLTKKKTFKIGVTKAKGKVTYTLNKAAKKAKIKVSKKGTVTIPKKCKKGTYKIKVKAAGTSKYKAAEKTVTIKVK